MAGFGSRLKHAWNAFASTPEPPRTTAETFDFRTDVVRRPDRIRFKTSNERSIISSIYTRLSIDAASIEIRHVDVDEKNRYAGDRNSSLNDCLTVEANIDQEAQAFRQDIYQSMFDRGVVAIVPVDTTLDPTQSGGYDIKTLRVGEITAWYPQHIKVKLWNEQTGMKQELKLEKKFVGIVENPLYTVMNEPNSTLQRLIRKLNILDAIDEQSGSGKLDLIIQLPYVIKSEARRQQAEQRREDIEFQLKGSQYGIAYTDGTEKITQLNRPAENNLLKQIEYLTEMLYSQLGLTKEVMDGTANEATMTNYHNRTIDPLLKAVSGEMKRKFLTKTARSQGQSIMYFRDPFKYVTVNTVAEIGDKFVRNQIAAPNEIRGVVGWAPSSDPNADKLQNPNMPAPSGSDTSQPSPPIP